MTQSKKLRFFSVSALLLLVMLECSNKSEGAAAKPDAQRNVEESQALVLLRGLPTLGNDHSIAIVELNPDATNFGAILQEFELPNLDASHCTTFTTAPTGGCTRPVWTPSAAWPKSACRATPAGPR